MTIMKDAASKNTDRELWREKAGDYYSPSLFVTIDGGIGIDVGGHVIVRPIREWHKLARMTDTDPLLTVEWSLEHAIEIAKIGGPYRSYDGTGGIWSGANGGIPDGSFSDWGLARATAIILNAAIDGRLKP